MSSNLRVELSSDGVQALLKGTEMQTLLSVLAAGKAAQAGNGYSYNVKVGLRRSYANIFPDTKEAYKDNDNNNTLLKVINRK